MKKLKKMRAKGGNSGAKFCFTNEKCNDIVISVFSAIY